MAVERLDSSAGRSTGERHSIEPIPLVRRTVTAFVGRTERGPVNEPVQILSFDQYQHVFGAHRTFSFLSYAVQHYFSHGGQLAVVVRVVNRATRASIDIPAGEAVLRLQARQPGSQEFLRASVDYDQVEQQPDRFNLVIQRTRGLDSRLVQDQELYPAVSLNQADARFIVDALKDSALIRLSGPVPRNRPDATHAANPGDPIPYVKMSAAGTDGDALTDYDIIGSDNEGTGLFALQRLDDLDLLCVPTLPNSDLGITTFLAAERYCERRRAMLIWDPPWSWDSATASVLGMRRSSYVSQNAFTYFPRITPRRDPSRFLGGIPACGAVAGMLARNDAGGMWSGLAGDDCTLKPSLAAHSEVDRHDAEVLRRLGVNALTRIRGGNFVLRGNVTLAGPNVVSSIWQNLGRRRLLFFALNSIERSTQWVSESLYEEETARNVQNQVMAYLLRLFKRGALAGRTPRQGFLVRVYAPTKDRRELTLRVGIALQSPGEFLNYEFNYGPDGSTTTTVPAQEADQLAG